VPCVLGKRLAEPLKINFTGNRLGATSVPVVDIYPERKS
jgi:hypothetical protein